VVEQRIQCVITNVTKPRSGLS